MLHMRDNIFKRALYRSSAVRYLISRSEPKLHILSINSCEKLWNMNKRDIWILRVTLNARNSSKKYRTFCFLKEILALYGDTDIWSCEAALCTKPMKKLKLISPVSESAEICHIMKKLRNYQLCCFYKVISNCKCLCLDKIRKYWGLVLSKIRSENEEHDEGKNLRISNLTEKPKL